MGEVNLQKNENDKLFSQVASRLNLERKKLRILRDNNPDKSVFDALLEENGLVDYFIFKHQYSNMVECSEHILSSRVDKSTELSHNEVGEEPILDEEKCLRWL